MNKGLSVITWFNVQFLGMLLDKLEKDTLKFGQTSEFGIMISYPNYNNKAYDIMHVK